MGLRIPCPKPGSPHDLRRDGVALRPPVAPCENESGRFRLLVSIRFVFV